MMINRFIFCAYATNVQWTTKYWEELNQWDLVTLGPALISKIIHDHWTLTIKHWYNVISTTVCNHQTLISIYQNRLSCVIEINQHPSLCISSSTDKKYKQQETDKTWVECLATSKTIYYEKLNHTTGTITMTFLNFGEKKKIMPGLYMDQKQFSNTPYYKYQYQLPSMQNTGQQPTK